MPKNAKVFAQIQDYMLDTNITIVGTHGRNTSQYLKDYLKNKGIESHAVGGLQKSTNTRRKIEGAKIVIFINEEIHAFVTENVCVEEKHVIMLDVYDVPESGFPKPLTGESWKEYQDNFVYPELERQIKKHLKHFK